MTSKKTLPIHNLKPFPPLLVETIEKKWLLLENEVVSILNRKECQKSFEELFRIAEELYSLQYTPVLKNLNSLFEEYLNQNLDKIRESDQILPILDNFWKEFCEHVKTIKNIFIYFDRSPTFFKYNWVQMVSFNLFVSIIIMNPIIKEKLLQELLKSIETQRDHKSSEDELIKSAINMLQTLQIYESIFVGEFLKSTECYYEVEGSKLIQTLEVSEFLLHVNDRITEEQERAKSFNSSIEPILLEIIYKQLIEKNITEILDKGFVELVEEKKFEELSLIFALFRKISNGSDHLVSYFKKYIINKGEILTDVKNERNLIQDLLDFRDNLHEVIATSFEDSKQFYECVKISFKYFINRTHAKIAQLLAKFLDLKLRGKELNDEEIEILLNKVMHLFKYIQSKDIFEAFYTKLLARRLLLGKSANQDAESSMISKLKEECGGVFTSKMEGMFQDINLSKNINTSFKQKIRNNEKCNNLSSDFTVNVLTSSFWPNYCNPKINLPVELMTYQDCFQTFYLNNHNGRKLLWQPSLGHCLIKAIFDSGYKELQVSLFQAIVLLLFNGNEEISYKEILQSTNLDDGELRRTLFSLVYGKAKILIKSPKTKEIDDEDVFAFNTNFTDKLFRVKINQIQLQVSAEEEKEMEKNVLVDRQFQIDAAIVRIMKNRRVIKHSALVNELYNILDIPVSQTDLKKRIEMLIEREYMERDKENKSNYIYIA